MEMIINLNNCSTYIPTGRVSNIFKFLDLKSITFEENKLMDLERKNKVNNFLSEDTLNKLTEMNVKQLNNSMKKDNQYLFNQLVINNLPKNIDYPKDIQEQFKDMIENNKQKILENNVVKEKILKLKKLKSINC